jgi:phosphohistidine phosphatase
VAIAASAQRSWKTALVPAAPIPMILYLMRHANAGTIRENPTLDAKRGLVKEGKEQCMLMARVLNALKAPIDVIISSPLKRALQTAQLVGTELGYEARVEISPALGLNGNYADFQKLLAKYTDREGILVVGHNPNMFQFLGRLITGNGGAAIRMRKASIARVDMNQHPPRLQMLMDPRSARAIYSSATKSLRPKTSRK